MRLASLDQQFARSESDQVQPQLCVGETHAGQHHHQEQQSPTQDPSLGFYAPHVVHLSCDTEQGSHTRLG